MKVFNLYNDELGNSNERDGWNFRAAKVGEQIGGELIAQRDSFLAAAKGVSIGIAFQKRIGVGFFGGEGFIMQRLQGDGWAFVHAGGMLIDKVLAPGEVLRVDTGCLVALQPSVDYNIEYVGGVKSAIFGGEGLFSPGDAYEDPKVIILHGRHGLLTWTAIVAKDTGQMSMSIANLGKTFAQFGTCTPE